MADDNVTRLIPGSQTTIAVVERQLKEMMALAIYAIRENDIDTAIQALICVQHMNLLKDKLGEFNLDDEPWCGVEQA